MISGYSIGESKIICPYIQGEIFQSENYIFEYIDDKSIDAVLEKGYRHFGKYFFRPVCDFCHRCLPIRIPVVSYHFSRNAKRLLKRNSCFSVYLVDTPEASLEKYELYKKHKKRFSGENNENESYSIFRDSFFHNFSFSKTLEIRDGDKLIAVTHLDVGLRAVSAVYCYYDTDYLSNSLGKFSIYKGIAFTKESGKEYYYLGYYIMENRHMSYKGDYKPNEILLEEGSWIENNGGNYSFRPRYRLLP